MLHKLSSSLVPLLFFLAKAQDYNSQYYDDGSEYNDGEYDMSYDVREAGDSDNYSDYSNVNDFDASGDEDDMIDNPADLSSIGEVSFDYETGVGLSSVQGHEDGEDGFRSANPAGQFISANDHQAALFARADMFRRGKKKKRKRRKKKKRPSHSDRNKPMFTGSKKKTYKLKNGAISAFEEAVVIDKGSHANGCDRGWHANNKLCANSCRVAWLTGNPRENWSKRNPGPFYAKNYKHTKCEACALWSKLIQPQSPAFYQKSLSNLKGGAPNYCKVGDPDCDAKETDFMACNGPAVCADDCWSGAANKKACQRCYNNWCAGDENTHRMKYYSVCTQWKVCNRRYPAHKYASSNIKYKLMGQNCWGKPVNEEEISEDHMTRMTQTEICHNVNKFGNIPYPDWQRFYKNCTKAICDNSNVEFFAQDKCDKMRCDKKCLNTHNMDPQCAYCRYKIDDMADCKSGDCKRIKGGIMCHVACQDYKNARLNGVDQNDPTYKANKAKCQGEMCQRQTQVGCKQCMDKCEKLGKRVYNTMLGTNIWKQNFDGWGCQYHCNAAHIGKLSEFRGVDIHDPAVKQYTNAFDALGMGAMDWEHMHALKEWAKNGYKSEE